MAGLAAGHLTEWEYWDAVAEYAVLLTSNVRLDPASRGAILTYLESCPRAEAKAALASLPGAPVGSPAPGGQPQSRLPEAEVVRSPE